MCIFNNISNLTKTVLQRKNFLQLFAVKLFKNNKSKKRYRKLKVIYCETHNRQTITKVQSNYRYSIFN